MASCRLSEVVRFRIVCAFIDRKNRCRTLPPPVPTRRPAGPWVACRMDRRCCRGPAHAAPARTLPGRPRGRSRGPRLAAAARVLVQLHLLHDRWKPPAVGRQPRAPLVGRRTEQRSRGAGSRSGSVKISNTLLRAAEEDERLSIRGQRARIVDLRGTSDQLVPAAALGVLPPQAGGAPIHDVPAVWRPDRESVRDVRTGGREPRKRRPGRS